MSLYTLPLESPDATLAVAGGKGANLARLAQAGLPVPGGFLLTTAAYRTYVAHNGLREWILAQVEPLAGAAGTALPASLQSASTRIRTRFGEGEMPASLRQPLLHAYQTLGSPPVAVRSSATAEDLPDLSFAGQQDTFLNVRGADALLAAVVACWSSLWTARAIGYRARNHIPQDEVALAVVVQQMIPSQASGVLFTANPLTGQRDETVIDAVLGLGEALVAGQVEPDSYLVDAQNRRIRRKTLGAKAIAIHGLPQGGTETVAADAATRQAIPDEVILRLADLGQQAAALYGIPQDVEWAWANEQLYLLQSRAITSLFPLPARLGADEPLRVLVSFGAVQGMLDPITPLGQDALCTLFAGGGGLLGYPTTPTAQRAMFSAGERLWINFTPVIRHPMGRRMMRAAFPQIEPGGARTIDGLLSDPALTPGKSGFPAPLRRAMLRRLPGMLGRVLLTVLRPAARRKRAHRVLEQYVAAYEGRFAGITSLTEWVDTFADMLYQVPLRLIPGVLPVVVAGIGSLQQLKGLAAGVPDAPDPLELMRGLPHNVTTEMDLALWATAARIREVGEGDWFEKMPASTLAAAYLQNQMPPAVQQAIAPFLRQYGMRGLAEIDLGRPRWRENPTPIMQTLQSYLQINDANMAPDMVFRRGAEYAESQIAPLVAAIRRQRGWLVAQFARRAAHLVREVAGLRELPKYIIVRLMGMARDALLAQGARLTAQGILHAPDDLTFLHFAELRALAAGDRQDWIALVAQRREAYVREKRRRQVPRVLLSDGRAFYDGVGAGADSETLLTGSPVSPGVVEGTVRVVFDPHAAGLQPGEILVCPGTDPAWTPLFLAAGGLVMEVGGMMTHGSVVAREYGIPAVVGVHEATSRLQTGDRVRVDGTTGQVEKVAG